MEPGSTVGYPSHLDYNLQLTQKTYHILSFSNIEHFNILTWGLPASTLKYVENENLCFGQ